MSDIENSVEAVDLEKPRARWVADDSLTKKASLNALAVALDYAAQLLVGFLTVPWLVAGLGPYSYGAWQILNRLIGYISPSSGRPTQALKWAIARNQSSTDYEQKQKYIGSTVVVWLLFLPLTLAAGAVVVWMAPVWLKAAPAYFFPIRACAALLVGNLAMMNLAAIPQSVLQGENLGYKRMGWTTGAVLVGGGFVWLAVHFHTGLAGVAGAALATTLFSGAVFFKVMRTNAKWFKISIPPFRETRQFLGLSSWFLGWNLVMNLMTASDVVILGFLQSPEAVTVYTLAKYAPEMLISLIALMNFGITPGLGGIIGAGRLKKAAEVRGEMMTMTWLMTTALGASILAWNKIFLDLWVGPKHAVGNVPAIAITLVVTQFAIIRCDAGIIDLSLNLRRKVVLGLLASGVAIALSVLFVGYFKLGIVGLCLGLILGRAWLSLEYPAIVGRYLGVRLSEQLRATIRPAVVTLLLYAVAARLAAVVGPLARPGLRGWGRLAGGAGITACLFLVVTFYLGLSGRQRTAIFRRLRALLSRGAA